METVIVNDRNVSTVIKEHIDEFDLKPLILISQINGMSDLDIDIFTVGVYPSKNLINIVAQVLQKLIQEREDYIAGRETT